MRQVVAALLTLVLAVQTPTNFFFINPQVASPENSYLAPKHVQPAPVLTEVSSGTNLSRVAAIFHAVPPEPAEVDAPWNGSGGYLHARGGFLNGVKAVTDATGRLKVVAIDQANSLHKMALKAIKVSFQGYAEPVSLEKLVADGKLDKKDVTKWPKEIQAIYNEWSRRTKQNLGEFAGKNGATGLLTNAPGGSLNYFVGNKEALSDAALIGRIEFSYDPDVAKVEPALLTGVEHLVPLGKDGKPDLASWEAIYLTVGRLKQMGIDAIKLLVYTRPGDEKFMAHQKLFLERMKKAAGMHDALLMVEELIDGKALGIKAPDDLKGEALIKFLVEKNQASADAIIKSVEFIEPYSGILKLEFPGDGRVIAAPTGEEDKLVQWLDELTPPSENPFNVEARAAHFLTKVEESDFKPDTKEQLRAAAKNLMALHRATKGKPWVMLSAGKDFGKTFKPEIVLALYFGASGYMVGRAFWKDVQDPSKFSNEAQRAFMADQTESGMAGRMAWANIAVDRLAIPFWVKLGITPDDRKAASENRGDNYGHYYGSHTQDNRVPIIPLIPTEPDSLPEPENVKKFYLDASGGMLNGIKAVTDSKGRLKVVAIDQANSLHKMALKAIKVRFEGYPEMVSLETLVKDGAIDKKDITKWPKEIQDKYTEWSRRTKQNLGKYSGENGATGLLTNAPGGSLNYFIGNKEALGDAALVGRIEFSYDPDVAKVEPALLTGVEHLVPKGADGKPDLASWEAIYLAVRSLKQKGIDAIKLLVYTRPGDEKFMAHQKLFLERMKKAVAMHDMLLMLEELIDGKALKIKPLDKDGNELKGDALIKFLVEKNQATAGAIIQSVEFIQPYSGILKLEYPGDGRVIAAPTKEEDKLVAWLDQLALPAENSNSVEAREAHFLAEVEKSDFSPQAKEQLRAAAKNLIALHRSTKGKPWVMLSAGKDFGKTFKPEIVLALYFGASGYMVGRAFWKDVQDPSKFSDSAQKAFMADTTENGMAGRMAWANKAVERLAIPFWEKLGVTPADRKAAAEARGDNYGHLNFLKSYSDGVQIAARPAADSRGKPTVEVTLRLGNLEVKGDVPAGASKGEDEAQTVSVKQAIENIYEVILPIIRESGLDLFSHENLVAIERKIIAAAGDNFKTLGANAVVPVSRALWKMAAKLKGMELADYIAFYEPDAVDTANTDPTYFYMNIFNGGLHALKKDETLGKDRIDIQEIMIVPVGAKSHEEALKMGDAIDQSLKAILQVSFFVQKITRADEAGFSVKGLGQSDDAIGLVYDAIVKAGYKPGEDVKLALDVAATSFLKDGSDNVYLFQGKERTSDEMIQYYVDLVERYHQKSPGLFLSIEDGLGENDWEAWAKLTAEMEKRGVLTIGDDIFVTQLRRLNRQNTDGKKYASAILIKVNQNGSMLGTLEIMKLAKQMGMKCVVSHRSGETLDDSIADLAYATRALGLKTGDPQPLKDFPDPKKRVRRVKYDRMVELEKKEVDFLASARRTPIAAGNWKMEIVESSEQAVDLLKAVWQGIKKLVRGIAIVAPSTIHLEAITQAAHFLVPDGFSIRIAAQNIAKKLKGALTGETSATQIINLKGVTPKYTIIGHSERVRYDDKKRSLNRDEFESINAKIGEAIKNGLTPIVCVGENEEERDQGRHFEVVLEMLKKYFEGHKKETLFQGGGKDLIIAYEPVWAIGTGKTATPAQAEEMQRYIRWFVYTRYGKEMAKRVKILYGGSVTPQNIVSLMDRTVVPNSDGALVGGASVYKEVVVNGKKEKVVSPDQFVPIVKETFAANYPFKNTAIPSEAIEKEASLSRDGTAAAAVALVAEGYRGKATGVTDKNKIEAIKKEADGAAMRIIKKIILLSGLRARFRTSEGKGRDEVQEAFEEGEILNSEALKRKDIFIDVIEGTNSFVSNNGQKTLRELKDSESGATSMCVTGPGVGLYGDVPDGYAHLLIFLVKPERQKDFTKEDLDPYPYGDRGENMADMQKKLEKIAWGNDTTVNDIELVLMDRPREKAGIACLKEIQKIYPGLLLTIINDGTAMHGTQAALGRKQGKVKVMWTVGGAPESFMNLALASALKSQGALAGARLYSKNPQMKESGTTPNLSQRLAWQEDEKAGMNKARSDEEKDVDVILKGEKLFTNLDFANKPGSTVEGSVAFITENGVFKKQGVRIKDGKYIVTVLRVKEVDGVGYAWFQEKEFSKEEARIPTQADLDALAEAAVAIAI